MTAFAKSLTPLTAAQELAVLRDYPRLIPGLMKGGLSLKDAAALAHNATLLYCALQDQCPQITSPQTVLNQISLGDIAALCRQLATQKQEGNVL